MARTPLLRSLISLALDHRIAGQTGCTVDEVREQRATHGALTRRRFIAAGAAAAAATVLPLSRARAGKSGGGDAPRIAIIGGGLSGLTVALNLVDQGYAPALYEAAPTLCGRTRSDRPSRPGCGNCHPVGGSVADTWAEGQVTDIFGELIDTDHMTVQGLAQRFALPLVDLLASEPAGATETYFFHGLRYPNADADADYAAVAPVIQSDLRAAGYPTTYASSKAGGRALDDMSVHEWIETRVPGGHASQLGMLLDVAYNIEYGAETTDQSALNLVYLLGYSPSRKVLDTFGSSDERYRVAQGIQSLPEAIAQYVAARCSVNVGWELTSLAQRPDGSYALSFDGRRAVVADVVVLSAPFAVLRTLDLGAAGFDALKLRAIRELGAGHNGKLQVQFKRRVWNERGPWGIGGGTSYADTGYQSTWEATRGQAGATGILVDYTGGDVADAQSIRHPYATASDAFVRADIARFLGAIEPVFPGLGVQWNGRAAGSMPHLNRFWNCSYSYWRIGQYHTIAGYEAIRQGNVFFAGEHTSIDFQGYMEGAAASGVRVANEVLSALGRKAAAG